MGDSSATPRMRKGTFRLLTGGSVEEVRFLYQDPSGPRVWSVSLAHLGTPELSLRVPLVVTIEDHGTEFLASWPEVEAWGSGASEAEALNELKDEIVRLHADLSGSDEASLGKLPRRWKAALDAVIQTAPSESR